MVSYSNIKLEPYETNENSNGTIDMVLRRNFQETDDKSYTFEETDDKSYTFEETNVTIEKQDNLEEYMDANFDTLFDLGIQQRDRKDRLKEMIENGELLDIIDSLGSQITTLMLGGM